MLLLRRYPCSFYVSVGACYANKPINRLDLCMIANILARALLQAT